MATPEPKSTALTANVPDAFVSHSSADKNRLVRPLVECLAEQGLDVWFDEYSMKPGDSLSASIDRGLANSRNGLVVISPSFIETALQSGWTHYELRGVVSNSIGSAGKRIVPIWLDVTPDEVRRWSPPLADLLAINATNAPVETVALKVLEVIAPEMAGGLRRARILAWSRSRPSKSTTVKASELKLSPAEDRRVAGNVPLRAFLITQTLADCGLPAFSDYDLFLENLSRDLHHEGELRVWETVAGCYAWTKSRFNLSSEQLEALGKTLLLATFGQSDQKALEILTEDVANAAIDQFRRLQPLVRTEAVIGEGGLRGILREEIDPAMSRPVAPSD